MKLVFTCACLFATTFNFSRSPVFRASTDSVEEPSAVLVRIFGNKTETIIDRKAELRVGAKQQFSKLHYLLLRQNFVKLSETSRGPNVHGTFANGLVVDFVPGASISAEGNCGVGATFQQTHCCSDQKWRQMTCFH